MASKKESEGMALLSMYNDDDEEMTDVKHDDLEESSVNLAIDEEHESINAEFFISNSMESLSPSPRHWNPQNLNRFRAISPQISHVYQQSSVISHKDYQSRKTKLTIVDYGHDEAQMSPEAEEGEITISALGDFCSEPFTFNRKDFSDDKLTLKPQVLSPEIQPTSSNLIEKMIMDTVGIVRVESETDASPQLPVVAEEGTSVDYLAMFFPPPPKTKCSDAVQEKINKFLAYKRLGKSFNSEVRNKKDYRNPDFLLHAVHYQDIDQIGSCFDKSVFDPQGYDKGDYYDQLEAGMKLEAERREHEKKKSQKVEFVPGGTHPGNLVPKTNLPTPATVICPSGSAETINRENRLNKKSKWDKVDDDGRQCSAIGAQASISSNPGAGYSAFAHQKRREAEEKLSVDKMVDRRS